MTALICVVCHRAITREMHRISAPVPGRPDVLVEYHVACWDMGHRGQQQGEETQQQEQQKREERQDG